MSDVLIRPATPDDAPGLAALLRTLERFDWLRAEEPAAAVARVRALLTASGDAARSIYVAIDSRGDVAGDGDGSVSGYVAVHWLPYFIMPGPEGYVSELFVAPAARGRGIGSRLLAAAVAEARARGCSRLGLLNNRRRQSYERGFYARHGWQERGDMANFVLHLE
jgi:GNAT superfamily N-acetyltransferase